MIHLFNEISLERDLIAQLNISSMSKYFFQNKGSTCRSTKEELKITYLRSFCKYLNNVTEIIMIKINFKCD